MVFVWGFVAGIIGLVIGGVIGNDEAATFGALAGAVAGVLFGRLGSLSARLHRAETQLADLWEARAQADADARPPVAVTPARAAPVMAPPPAFDPPPRDAIDAGVLDLSAVPRAPRVPGPPPSAPARQNTVAPPLPLFPPPLQATPETGFDRAIGALKAWFTEGNVPVKVGMLVLFAGVAALLKYAADEGWLTLPIELRLAGVAIAAIAALAFGWRQRDNRRAFALSLQGGAIGILLLTVFAAFRLYSLIPAGAAFGLMLVLVAGVGVLAVLQDALALAVLGILAGFAAPILLSTGSGNHVVLFSYYALLNVAIFAIAWVRPWRALNLLGFFFTFAIGTGWGVLKYRPELFASTEPFLLLYFALYLAIPILYALRSEPSRRDAVDGTLVFGNPLIAFALQAALLDGERMPLALSALALGVIYLMLAWPLMRRVRVLGESFAVLAVGFATLAVPLGLSARVTGAVFALEGAALVWLGLRQQRRLPQWTGLALQALAACAFVIAFDWTSADTLMFANGRAMGALMIAGAAFTSAWLYLRANAAVGLSTSLYLWGLLWWCATLLVEIERFVAFDLRSKAVVAAVALTAWLAAEADRSLRQPVLAWTSATALWFGVAMSLIIGASMQPFSDWGALAYALFALAGWRSLLVLRDNERSSHVVAFAHLGWLWTWTVAAAASLGRLGESAGFADGWQVALGVLPVLIAFAWVLRAPSSIAVPLADRFAAYRPLVLGSQLIVLALDFLGLLVLAGDSAPLPFLPLINPIELIQLAILIAFALWTREADAPAGIARLRPLVLAAAGFAFVTAATLRAVHHLGGMAWDSAIISATISQTSLAVVWSVLGVLGWVIGSRRGNRPLWLAGALLMAVVLVKLLLIDRQHLGNLFGIASFIAYGLLCTLIGYLAPAPPRAQLANTEAAA